MWKPQSNKPDRLQPIENGPVMGPFFHLRSEVEAAMLCVTCVTCVTCVIRYAQRRNADMCWLPAGDGPERGGNKKTGNYLPVFSIQAPWRARGYTTP